MVEPIITVELLNRLMQLGFDDEHFGIVHHFAGEPIEPHQKYCEQHAGLFQVGGTNERVQKRLRIVLNCYIFGGFSCPAAFKELAHASVTEVPF